MVKVGIFLTFQVLFVINKSNKNKVDLVALKIYNK